MREDNLQLFDEKIRRDVESIINQFPVSAFFVDEDHTILLLNEHMRKSFGIEEKDFIRGKCPEKMHGTCNTPDGCPLEKSVTAGGENIEEKVYDINNDLWFDTAVYPSRYVTDDGKRVYIHTVKDVTKEVKADETMKKSLEKERELNKLKSSFVAMISHELRTPVTSIKGFLSFLNNGIAGPLTDKQKEFMESVNSNLKRLAIIIDDLLDISKIESGVFSVVKKECDMNEIVKTAVKDMAVVAESRKIKIEFPLNIEPVTGNMDSFRMYQVVVNLINNAIKFSENGSTVFVGVEKYDDSDEEIIKKLHNRNVKKSIMLRVRDMGAGIREGCEKMIFDKFYQQEDINCRRFQGAGIGLSIAKGLVEAHEGVIWAESEGEGQGSEFKVLIPA